MSEADTILAAIAQLGADINGRIDGLEGRMDGLEGRMEGLSGDLTRLRVEMMDRLDRQQNLLTAMKDDMQVNFAAVDTTRNALKLVRNEQGDLVHQVSIIHRRLLQLEQRFDARESGT